MEEPGSPGSSQPTKRITDKLPPENGANNTDTPPTTTSSNGQSQPDAINRAAVPRADEAPTTVDSLQLVVIEGFQVGRGVARIDPSDMAKLSCQPGDIVMVIG